MKRTASLCCHLIVPLTFLFPLASFARGDESVAEEMNRFTGGWRCVEGQRNGQKFPEDAARDIKLIFMGDNMVLEARGRQTKFVVKVDPTKSPRLFVMTALDGKFKDKTAYGIYEWSDNQLRLCIANRPKEDSDPPKNFDTRDDPTLALMIFERIEDEELPEKKSAP